MAKKTTKKTTEKKPVKTTKTVTMPERVRRIELDVNRHGANMAAITAAMREQLTSIAEEAMRASTMAHHARTNSRGNTVILNKLQSDLSLLLSGASFTQELQQAKPTEEQGLEPGDYTDASKEVADELTAMRLPRFSDRSLTGFPKVVWSGSQLQGDECTPGAESRTYYSRPEFLSRARVTAKRLGLVPVEPKPWKPEAGELVTLTVRSAFFEAGHCDKVLHVDGAGDVWLPHPDYPNGACVDKDRVRKPTPEEVAKHKEEQELAKPIVPYETRVMYDDREWVVVARYPSQGLYTLARQTDGDDELVSCVGRKLFTVLP